MIRQNEEHWKSNLLGLSYNRRLEAQIHQKLRVETLEYILAEMKRNRKVRPSFHETVICAALNGQRKIKDISFNKPNDLITDNFGKWLASLIYAPDQTNHFTEGLVDVYGVTRALYLNRNDSPNYDFLFSGIAAIGAYIVAGSAGTTPQRYDYALASMWSYLLPPSTGSYSAGNISFSASLVVPSPYFVTNTGMVMLWQCSEQANELFLMFHDLLEDAVYFDTAQTLLFSYSINLG